MAHESGSLPAYNVNDEPCKRMTIYYHDILFKGEKAVKAAAAAASVNDTFGQLVVFDAPVMAEPSDSEPVMAHGFYFYNRKEELNTWFAFTLVFDSIAYKGTLNLMGADLMATKTGDLSVVGGTGDFFMARGVATIGIDSIEDLYYFGFKMDIKLYECHVA